MRWTWMVVVAALAGGCASVKVAQRDGCWIRETKQWWFFLPAVKEELGPCARPPPTWAQDRHTRLVQECVAEADYRWQGKALAAWTRGETIPAQAPEEAVLRNCMDDANTSLAGENDQLKQRIGEVTAEREKLRAALEEMRASLGESNAKLADYLGEAAQKPAGTATATASSTSDGTAKTGSGVDVGMPPPVQQTAPAMAPRNPAPATTPVDATRPAPDATQKPAPAVTPVDATRPAPGANQKPPPAVTPVDATSPAPGANQKPAPAVTPVDATRPAPGANQKPAVRPAESTSPSAPAPHAKRPRAQKPPISAECPLPAKPETVAESPAPAH